MSRIDNYLQSMERFKASALKLSSGGNVILCFPAGDRQATQTTSHGQLQEMIREIAPGDTMVSLGEGSASTFIYKGATSTFEIAVVPSGKNWAVTVVLAKAGATSASGGLSGKPSSDAAPVHEIPPPESVPMATPAPASSISASSVSAVDPNMSWIDRVLHKMMDVGSSDLHLSSGAMPCWRLDGEIQEVPGEELLNPEFVAAQIDSIFPDDNRKEFAERNDTDFAYEIKGLSRFRVNVFRDRKGVGTVMRTIPFKIPSAKELGVPDAILDMAHLSKGLVLVTGPTGSGKSTTLAALIDHINQTRRDHLITIEDPIEFVHPNKKCLVNQREIRRHTNSFKDALRAALREDPDIVLVGEMRDLETIEIAVETAETGHLVFGTLHTTTAPSTVDRIIDQFPSDRQEQIRQMLASSLKGVVSQVLCKKKGGGRIAAHEILIGTPAVQNLIREHKTFQLFSLMQTGKRLGMCKMEDTLIRLVKDDLVEPGEAYRQANNKQEFKGMLERAGFNLEGKVS